jgi:heme oxygenase
MSSLFARLKSGTEEQHRTIEAAVDPMHTFSSMGAYKAYLLNSWIFHASLEAELDLLDWSALGIDFVSRRKTPLLEQDLRILGVPRPSLEQRPYRRARTDLSFALGCLYVLEGATLGGRVISRHLATLGIGPANGGLFFNGYGARTGEMWQSFQLKAAEYCVTDAQIEVAVQGATWTFGQFRDSMGRGEGISDAS